MEPGRKHRHKQLPDALQDAQQGERESIIAVQTCHTFFEMCGMFDFIVGKPPWFSIFVYKRLYNKTF
jgi:hypothetical protein